jgi:FKBP-type peptidyl-prolyl cis-trans isomerase FklB
LETQLDSVSYALGFFGAKQVKKSFEQSPFKIDSVDFIKIAKAMSDAEMNEQFVTMMSGQFDTIDVEVYKKGFFNQFAYGKSYFDEMSADAYLRKIFQQVKDKKATNSPVAIANLKKGNDFLAANKAKKGIIVTASGLQYEIIKEGKGAKPSLNDVVKCDYRGTLIDGTQFDSSYDRGKPATFSVTGVIKGWTEALQLMPVGSKWKLYIPANLAYGVHGSSKTIGPNETLIFEIELLNIEPKK